MMLGMSSSSSIGNDRDNDRTIVLCSYLTALQQKCPEDENEHYLVAV